ncbi:MAG: methylmalonyl-CoA mutase subunit beta [Bosea sp. (in: a-proteobacteria)]
MTRSDMSSAEPTIFSNTFPAASDTQWRAAVEKALKGADFEKRLVSRGADGFAIQPLYPRREGSEAVLRAEAGARWQIAQRIDLADADAAHRQVMADLEGGASSLALVLKGAATARGFGLIVNDLADLDTLLEGVFLDLITLRIETAPFDGRRMAELLPRLAARRKLQPDQLDVDLGLDPVGDFACTGAAPLPMPQLLANMASITADLHKAGIGGRFVRIDARAIHEAGGSEGQELGYALACAVAYLRALEAGGMPLEAARERLSFTLAVDADQLFGIAKLRALRKLMARVEEACGLEPAPIHVHAETAWRMMSRIDAPVNMLRNAIAVFSSGIGGADSISVLPHSLAQGLPDGFARRTARNTQHVLLEESNLWRVADPAAGSGGLEALTDELCAAGWAMFQAIEQVGGITAALESGMLQAKVAGIRASRDKGLGTRRTPLTGVSEFPNLSEPKPDVVEGVMPAPSAKSGPVALPSIRLSQAYEALRDRADAQLASTGTRPAIFLANLGRIADFNARATFARALFEAGGIQAPANDGFAEEGGTNLVALTDAFKASGATIACICSSDAFYVEEASDAAMALMASGARKVWLAGKPAELEAQLTAAGISGYVFTGCDVLATLKEALDVTGA